jgi:hypothetical protein
MKLLQSLGMIERGGRENGVRRYGHRKRPVRQIEDGDAGISVLPDYEPMQRLPMPAQLISPEPARSGLHR